MIRAKEERFSRKKIEELQSEKLKNLVRRVYRNVPFYKKAFDKAGVKPSQIKSVKDLARLPFTVKDDLRKNYPFKMFAKPMDQVVRIHASSGTTGKPTVVGYTAADIETWAEVMARTFACAGATKHDVVHNSYGYGLFTGGLGAHYGASKLGCAVVPASGGNTQRQIMIIHDFNATVICATPSYILNMAEVAEREGMPLQKSKLRVGLFGAEPWSESMRKQIEKRLKIKAIDIYGLSEIIGPGVASECVEAQNGLHVFEDHFIVEVIDPATGDVLPPGEKGELVFTTLTKEAFPLIRYRTRDISQAIVEKCKCGRTTTRIERVSGRTDDMLIIRGVNVFPSQIESVLLRFKNVSPHYQLVVERAGSMDNLQVLVEVDEKFSFDEIRALEKLEKDIQFDIKDFLGVSTKVKLVEHQSIARSEGKAIRVIDKRK
jgi:phenylacetate-CoA ligase